MHHSHTSTTLQASIPQRMASNSTTLRGRHEPDFRGLITIDRACIVDLSKRLIFQDAMGAFMTFGIRFRNTIKLLRPSFRSFVSTCKLSFDVEIKVDFSHIYLFIYFWRQCRKIQDFGNCCTLLQGSTITWFGFYAHGLQSSIIHSSICGS
jgi:hypothetical protein